MATSHELEVQLTSHEAVCAERYQTGNALQIAPVVAGIARGVKAVPAMINEMRSTPLPLEWYHGTSPEGAQAIRQSGQFNPNAGKRTYEYSELGPNTVYFAPEGSWWLDPTKAEAGRAMSYKDQVSMRLSKDANVKVIDSPAQFDKIANHADIEHESYFFCGPI